ncbi:MAG: UDP-glucose 4-epimerase GalE [Candidatus Daviesbacteria bacterium]|nr:UDP-glucose 4-epimerase GalE [Candidatus Daviesbacteria bacterium]
MTILVTGGYGYLGSVCVQKLLEKKYPVVILDNLRTGHQETINPKVPFYKGSILNKKLLNRIFSENKIDCVIHFAAITTIEESSTNPSIYFNTNVTGGICLLDVMRKYVCKKIIFSSTAAVFGLPKYIPIDENHPTNPINSYGSSKLMFEQILFWYQQAYGLKYRIFRYFNAAGATEISGDNHHPENHLIPNVLNVVLGVKKEISIYGNDYDTPDGTCIRDYIHVLDLIDAHILSLENWEVNPAAAYNLGNEKGYSVLEVVETARRITGHSIPLKISSRRPGDPPVLIASNFKTKKELTWEPKFLSLEDMIASQWKWQKKNYETHK